MEVELNLVDADMNPAKANATVLDAIADPDFQTELGQFNIEINVAPLPFVKQDTISLEQALRTSLNRAEERASATGNHLAMIGMLPTLRTEHFAHHWISANPGTICSISRSSPPAVRDMEIDITGVPLSNPGIKNDVHRSIRFSPRRRGTSLRLSTGGPEDFAALEMRTSDFGCPGGAGEQRNRSRRKGPRWHESRIPVFRAGHRYPAARTQESGRTPTGVVRRNAGSTPFRSVRGEHPLFPRPATGVDGRRSAAELDAAAFPSSTNCVCTTAPSTAGIVRCTTSSTAKPICAWRIGLPAGPTVVDTMAKRRLLLRPGAWPRRRRSPLWSDVVRRRRRESAHRRPRRHRRPTVLAGTRLGTSRRTRPAQAPAIADDGLRTYGVGSKARTRYLSVIEGRCLRRQTGSVWQRNAVAAREKAARPAPKLQDGMLRDYLTLMHEGEPVHSWPL